MITETLHADVSRRGFLTTGLIVGFTLATGPVNAQSLITTDTGGLARER
jgi:hypothetical protein